MMNILRQLYGGAFSPFERKVYRTSENKELHKKIENEVRYFVQKMSMDDVARFQNLENLYMEASSYEQEDAFAYGFKMSLMLGCATFADEI